MNIKEEVIIEELKEEYFKRTGRKIEEYGYCTIASEIKEIEPEYLEHKELYKKLDYLHSIVINNIGQHLIRRKETYNTVGELNIYNCYSDNRTWNKLTIARSIFKLQEQVYQPYLGHEIGIVAANSLYANIIENIILIKPEDLGETKYIKKNKRKESIILLYQKLEKHKSDLKAELFELALRYESKNQETLNIYNCFENEEYWEIKHTKNLKNTKNGIGNENLLHYWNNPYNEYEIISYLPERRMTQLILFTEIENETCILLAQRINPNKDFYLKLNGPGGKANHEKNENIDVCVIRECFEEAEIVLRNEKLLKTFEETCYSTKEWRAEPCLQKEAKYIKNHQKHTEPHTLGPWNLYKIKDLLKYRNELVPVLEENIELIDGKIKTYEQDVLGLPINIQKLEEIKMEKQPQRTQETFNFLNDIDLEIPEEEIPEIMDEQFPVLALNFGKLSSYEIQTLIKYKKKIQESIRPLRRIEHKIQTIEKS
ncbi:hypothetical protein C2G38_2191345 [Gigaspora rosea]|uniref:Nudix hydrolase domain-containing protein n=1 Tax=Gigaspora rosea TaxID=44941 RepID=A0A397V1U8_9GLOM|nr:hypothetical protein C2G38_2191345 [Gigaspora rosea]